MADSTSTLQLRVKIDGDKAAKTGLDGLAGAAKKTEGEFGKLNKTVPQTNTHIGNFGKKAGMAGIQIQQFVGQVKGGQNAMQALSMQAADLGFVLGFPLAGAVAGITAAIAGPFIESLFDAGNSTEALDESLERLDDTTRITAAGTAILTKEIVALSKANRELAKLEIMADISEATIAAATATALFSDEIETIANKESGSGQMGASIVKRNKAIAESYGITLTQLREISAAQREIDLNPTDASILALREKLVAIATTSPTATGKFIDFTKQVVDASNPIANTTKQVEELQRALAILESGGELVDPTAKVKKDKKKKDPKAQGDEHSKLLDEIYNRTLTHDQRMNDRDTAELNRLNSALAAKEISWQDHLLAVERLEELSAQRRLLTAEKERQEMLTATAATAGAINGMFVAMGKENSKEARIAFGVQQGLNIASATSAIITAAAQSQADPTSVTMAQKIANYATLISTLTPTIAAIKNAGKFEDGGIVGGSSYTGDRMNAQVNSGEMILNRKQQANLFAMANGGGGGINIINNTQGRIDSVSKRTDDKGEMWLEFNQFLTAEVTNPNSEFNKNMGRTRRQQPLLP
jgi:hypothetical protein